MFEDAFPAGVPEKVKFRILVDHLKFKEAQLIAESCECSSRPYTDTMAALGEQYGQAQWAALEDLEEAVRGPRIKSGDVHAFRTFAFKVKALVPKLTKLGSARRAELKSVSRAMQLVDRLSPELRTKFDRCARYAVQGWNRSRPDGGIGLTGRELSCQRDTVPNCDRTTHSLNYCQQFRQLSVDEKRRWIKKEKKCWRCARLHLARGCDLKKRCSEREQVHRPTRLTRLEGGTRMGSVWNCDLSRPIKLSLFYATVEFVLLYGSECWTRHRPHERC